MRRFLVVLIILVTCIVTSCGKSKVQSYRVGGNISGEILEKTGEESDGEDASPFFKEKPPVSVNYSISIAIFGPDYETREVENSVYRYSNLHPSTALQIIEQGDSEAEKEANKSRIFADLLSGGGPDLLSVSYEDMLNLWEKGAIIPIGEMIAEQKDEVYESALNYGTVDNELVALIPTICQVWYCVVNAETCRWSEWNLDTVLKMSEENEFRPRFVYINGNQEVEGSYASPQLPFCLSSYDSRFIDYQNGISKFDSEDFKRLISMFAREMDRDTLPSKEDVLSGKCLGTLNLSGAGVITAIADLEKWGGKGKVVGCPKDGKNGYTITAYNFLVVNKNSKNMDAVKKYLQYVISYDNQRAISGEISIRKDVLGEAFRVITSSSGKEDIEYYYGNGNAALVDTSKSLDEVLTICQEIMENSTPYNCDPTIDRIVNEEIDEWLLNRGNIDEFIKKLNNRVQLYLDEKR